MWRWARGDGALSSLTYDHRNRQRRQDAPEDLSENGSIYVLKPEVLRAHGNRLGGAIALYRMHVLDSFQVDEPGDIQVMNELYELRGTPLVTPDLAAVRLLVLDFDGVLTDNRVAVDQDGREVVHCSRGDGFGIARLREQGVDVAVLSAEKNPVVSARCDKLGVQCVQSVSNKREVLEAWVRERGLSARQVAYVGNDESDMACMRWVGVPVAVADAEPCVRSVPARVTRRPGGHGAVREVCDWLREARLGGTNG